MRAVSLLLFCLVVSPAEEAKLNPHLQPLAPLLGKTYRGTLTDANGKPVATDISRWEAILNGQAVRILHSVNNGAYGGESIIRWDEQKGTLTSYYATTAGFHTTGTARVEGNRLHTEEDVHGNAGGATAVRAITEIQPDGGFKVSVSQLRNGQWEKGGERVYRVDPEARVIFKDVR